MSELIDLGMLANDLAEVLSEDHGIDVDANDVMRGLDAFLATIQNRPLYSADQIAAMEEDAEADEVAAEQLTEDWQAVLECDGTTHCTAELHAVGCMGLIL